MYSFFLIIAGALLPSAIGSLDFTVSHDGGMTREDVYIKTVDEQTQCLKLITGFYDVELECSITNKHLNEDEYMNHCTYATNRHKAKSCCQYCCKPMTFDEGLHYAATGGQRCMDTKVFCNERAASISAQWRCSESEGYEAYLQVMQMSLKTYLATKTPDAKLIWTTRGFTNNVGAGGGDVLPPGVLY